MKKLILLTAVFTLSACACMDSDEPQEPVVYKTAEKQEVKNMDCDYFDGKTCYRVVRRTHQFVAPAPVVRYREVAPCAMQAACASAPVVAPAAVLAPCSGCAPKVTETREPIEITYKKTTYTTTYEPKVTSSVKFEKVACGSAQNCGVAQAQAIQPLVEVPTVAQPAGYDNDSDILLNVK